MQAETLNCPMCGAAARSDSPHCQHCGARLATIACPSCFGLMFLGARFCSHCGAKAQRRELDATEERPCPRCKINLAAAVIGALHVRECARCYGIWVDAATLEELCADREKQAAMPGSPCEAVAREAVNIEHSIRYVPCPVCRQLMNRVNFARCSSIIVDLCRQHGTWFDRDELRRMVEFVRGGGFEKAKRRALEEMQVEERRLRNSREVRGAPAMSPLGDRNTAWAYGIQEFLTLFFSLWK